MRGGKIRTPELNRHILRYLCVTLVVTTTAIRCRERGKTHGRLPPYMTPSSSILSLSSFALVSLIHEGGYQCSSGINPKCTGPEMRTDTRLFVRTVCAQMRQPGKQETQI